MVRDTRPSDRVVTYVEYFNAHERPGNVSFKPLDGKSFTDSEREVFSNLKAELVGQPGA